MRVLILGGGGLLGHRAYSVLSERFETWATFRGGEGLWRQLPVYERSRRIVADVDAERMDSVVRAFQRVRPDAVVNCIGLVKQLPEAQEPARAIAVNALFPHRLASLCGASGARLVHVSTDCVFSGERGMYREGDVTDSKDLYGRTKALGEVVADGCVTLRTSIIGRDFLSNKSLVEWFLSNRGGRVEGYRNAVFSGLPTATLASVIGDILEKNMNLSGLYHVASSPIDKYALLVNLRDALDAKVEITPVEGNRIDRSLDGSRFAAETGFVSPDWEALSRIVAEGSASYDAWRLQHAVAR